MSAPEDSGPPKRATRPADAIWQRQEIESPCTRVCVIHPAAKICTGCYRTGDEITQWSRMTPEERRAVMAELPTRAPLLKVRRGGRAGRRRRDGS